MNEFTEIDDLKKEVETSFSIKAKTCTLKYNHQQKEDFILIDSIKYVIPIYQRPYSWSEEQVKKFISDIFISFHGHDRSSISEPMFIGTMQLSARRKDSNKQEIIDGQQRITTFLVLLKILKNKYPEHQELKNIHLNFLETEVNNGEQSNFLSEFLIIENLFFSEKTHNPYINNAKTISSLIDKETSMENESSLDLDLFIKHILTNIYFVIIETSAGLSKTLKIFDAINTTGLDLNGGDIFKIRMYEYLTTKKGYDKTAFNEISELYGKIDRKNKEENCYGGISDILRIYQHILISKYNLSNTLFSLAVDTFFDRLFDVIFNITQWDGFKASNSRLELSLDEINRIIDVYYSWNKLKYPTVEDACAMHFIWTSRYGKHSILVYLFLYKFQDANGNELLFEFIKKISKLFIIYSVFFDKQIGHINNYIHGLLKSIFYNSISFDQIISSIEYKITGAVPYSDSLGKSFFEYKLKEEIAYNHTKKYILCRLSAMLVENYKSDNQNEIKEIRQKIFNSDTDIEHIQSYNDENEKERELIKKTWGSYINSLGNLIILERNINRSIKNKPYNIKIEHYDASIFNIVKQQIIKYNDFNLDYCKVRKEEEVKKLVAYIFE